MRKINCIICKKDFSTNQRGTVKMCSTKCRLEKERKDSLEFRRKKTKTGDDIASDIYFGNAKEPLMPATGNHGFLGVISYNKTRDKIQCHICGKFFRSLNGSGHLRLHSTTNDEYKKQFEIARTVALVSESTREKQLQNFMNRTDVWRKPIKEFSTNEQRRKASVGKKRRIYTRNRTGHCPLQLLEPIKTLAEKLGHTPNGEDFRREYNRKFISTINQTYGSFNEALKVAGFEPRPRCELKYTEDELVEMMKNFYDRFGRTPANTDFKRGYLPLQKHYIKRFGNMNRARVRSGVPLMIRIGGWRWKEIPLTKKLRKQFV